MIEKDYSLSSSALGRSSIILGFAKGDLKRLIPHVSHLGETCNFRQACDSPTNSKGDKLFSCHFICENIFGRLQHDLISEPPERAMMSVGEARELANRRILLVIAKVISLS